METFEVISVSETSLTFSWSQPSTGAHLTTGYNLTCVPLLIGIPFPQSLSLLAPNLISATLSGLFSGVPYNCSISTISDRGSSLPANLYITTNESGIYYTHTLNTHCGKESIVVGEPFLCSCIHKSVYTSGNVEHCWRAGATQLGICPRCSGCITCRQCTAFLS